jgi:type I restriction enzyme S subunit
VFRFEEAGRVSEQTYGERIVRAEPRHGDLFYSREGTYFGIAAEVPPGVRVCLGQRMVLLRADPSCLDSRFLRFWLNSPTMALHVHGQRDGSVAERLNLPTIRALPVAFPPLCEQRVIAHILGTLDDKIGLNQRMNETLEAMARALFKSWFVDFDLVRAKAEGRQPAGDRATADLFPAEFAESALGKIPDRWRVAPIGEVVKVVGGSTPRTDEPTFWNGQICFVTPKDLSELVSRVLLDTERRITERGLSQIGSGLLPRGTVLLSSRAPIGYLAIAEVPVAVNQGFIAMICRDELPNQYVLRWAQESMDTIVGRANGTTFLEVSKQNFRPIEVIVPARPVVDRFVEVVEPLHDRVITNLRESITLAQVRDCLLPKLLSGEIRVKQAERPAEAAT